jgi:uncharacterized protein HemX
MNEHMNNDGIRQLLDRSLSQLDQSTLARLREARQHAVRRAAHSQSPAQAWLDTHFSRFIPRRHATATWVAITLLIAVLLGSAGYYWQQTSDADTAVDIAILTDDLPISYYVD